MSFDSLLKEVETLGGSERRRLIAYMVALEDRSNSGYAGKLAEKIDNNSPERWLTVEECERELGLSDETR